MKYICKNIKEVEQIANYKCYDKEKLNTILGSIKLAIMNEQEEKDYIQIQFKIFENHLDHGKPLKEHMIFCVGRCSNCFALECEERNNKMKEVNVSQMFRELKLKRII